MGLIENPKHYTGRDLETIFFRPMLTGDNAEKLGIKVLYNMPVPTTIQLWSPREDILQAYSSGWTGGSASNRKQKTLAMHKIKAELGFSASEYFQSVFELITGRADVNMDDLTGTELEQAETEMFRSAIAESLRVMMWVGDTAADKYNNFDGFLTLIYRYADEVELPSVDYIGDAPSENNITSIFNDMWDAASPRLKALKAEGNLAFFVTSDVYEAYERYLDQFGVDNAYTDLVTGRRELAFHGIKIVDMGINHCMPLNVNSLSTHCILTDRLNLVMAVNTADYPGSEVRMWYNPDEMENRQRATFMVGCDVLDEELVVLTKFA